MRFYGSDRFAYGVSLVVDFIVAFAVGYLGVYLFGEFISFKSEEPSSFRYVVLFAALLCLVFCILRTIVTVNRWFANKSTPLESYILSHRDGLGPLMWTKPDVVNQDREGESKPLLNCEAFVEVNQKDVHFYRIEEQFEGGYKASLKLDPFTPLGQFSDLEAARSICQKHDEDHHDDYIIEQLTQLQYWDRL